MNYRDLAPDVQPDAPGCPIFQVERAVRKAAIELLSKSDLYRAEPADLALDAGETLYEIEAPEGAELNRVLDVQLDGVSLKKEADEASIYSMLARTQPAKPTHFYQRDNEAIIIAPAPDKAMTVKVFKSLKPTSTSVAIPDSIGHEHRDMLAHGAKAHLLLMNAQPWSNPQLGAMHKLEFTRAISSVIRRVKFGFNGAPMRVKPRPFI